MFMDYQGCVDMLGNYCESFSNAVGICQTNELYYVCDSLPREQFKSLNNNEIKILEIGPYSNPYYRGVNVKYFDAMTQEEIKYQIVNETDPGIKNNVVTNSFELSRVPKIDYVNKNGDMSSIKETFDLIFSSHNIEHQVDLVSHLQQLENLVNDNGQIILLIPDKRFCFDHFIPESPFSDVLESYYNKDKSHPLRTILAMVCETTHNLSYKHHAGYNGEIKGKDVNCYKEALERYNNAQGDYINAHRWRFTPQQFGFIVNGLNKLDLVHLRVEKLYLTKNYQLEFYAILKKF